MTKAQRIAVLCRDCAESIHGRQQPTPAYIDRVTTLLFMTGAHESGGFWWRRQLGFSRDNTRGAFGLWQVEWGSIEDSVKMLGRHSRRTLRDNCITWLDKFAGLDDVSLTPGGIRIMLYVLQEVRGDPLGCLLARLHYLRNPNSIPIDLPSQARYAKRVYNTTAGSATAADYLKAFRRYWPNSEKEQT